MKQRFFLDFVIATTLFVTFSVGRAQTSSLKPQFVNVESSFQVSPTHIAPGQTVTIQYFKSKIFSDKVFIHFGFNSWSLPLEGYKQSFDESRQFYRDQRLSWNSSVKAFEATIKIPDDARILNAAFCWNMCLEGEWDNNDAQDYLWPIQFPMIGPILTWNQEVTPGHGVVITFEHPFTNGAWLEYWTEGGVRERINNTESNVHHFILKNLKPRTRYFYRVAISNEICSPIYSFESSPIRSNNSQVSFIALGDVQRISAKTDVYDFLIKSILVNHRDVDFLISTGDLTNNNNYLSWWVFFDKSRELLARKVIMPAPGNHDAKYVGPGSSSTSFSRYFNLPYAGRDRLYYMFTYEKLRLFSLNSEIPGDFTEQGEQYRWLKSEFEKTNQSDWTFVYWHKPPVNLMNRHFDEQLQFRPISTLFEGIVDWHVSVHVHGYQRTRPVDYFTDKFFPKEYYGTSTDQGVGFIILPPAGFEPSLDLVAREGHEELYNIFVAPAAKVDALDIESTPFIPPLTGFVRFDVEGSRMNMRAYGMRPDATTSEMRVFDSLIYSR